jgi:hypothetical protein
MSENPAPQFILLHETALQSWARDAGTLATIVILIGLGVALDSGAMQWVGAIMFWISFLWRMGKKSKECQRLTPQQAADYLAEHFDVVATTDREGGEE